jgi:hypothetical protein
MKLSAALIHLAERLAIDNSINFVFTYIIIKQPRGQLQSEHELRKIQENTYYQTQNMVIYMYNNNNNNNNNNFMELSPS